MTAIQVKGKGGTHYEIALVGADERRYLGLPEPAVDFDICKMPEYIRNYVVEYELILEKTAGMTGAQLVNFLAEYKPLSPHIKLSPKTLYRKRALFQKFGRGGIVPAWGAGGKVAVTPEQLDYFKRLYLKESGPSAEKCRIITFGKFKKDNQELSIDAFPSARAFLRSARSSVGESYIDFARKGKLFYQRNHEYFIDRDWTAVPAGSWLMSDHHQLDVLCVDKYGVQVRPWVTAWMDVRSYKIVSAWLHQDKPNSDHIFMSLAWAVEKFGLPDGAYLDNGKDYRSRDLTGNPKRYGYWTDESKRNAECLFKTFGIQALFAREYNAQAKTIESRFRLIIAGFSKLFTGYTGSNTVTRPGTLKDDVAAGKLLPFEEVQNLFDDFIENTYNNTVSHGKLLDGLSPNKAFEQYRSGIIRKPSDDSMQLLYMRGRITTIGRRGVIEKLNGVEISWWNDSFYTMRGKKVYVRVDVRKYNKAYVHDADTGEFICLAHMDNRMPGIVTDIDKTELRDAIKRKNKDLRLARDAVRVDPVDVREMLDNEKRAVMAIDSENSVQAPAARTEVVVTTGFDRIRKELADKENVPQVDLYEITPDRPPRNEYDDIDVWGLKSVNKY